MRRDPERAMFAVAILAGGLATRMRPMTETIPKSMIKVAGRPFIEHQLEQLQAENIQDVVLCTGYLGEMIQAHIGDGKRFGLSVSYSFDGKRQLGTGGALKQALPLLGRAFFELYGDSFLDVSYASVQAAYRASGQPALMTVFRNESQWDLSNVLFDGNRVTKYDKRHPTLDMKFIDYGLGILNADLLRSASDTVFDLSDVYTRLSDDGKLAGFEATSRFYEIGTPLGLDEVSCFLKKGKSRS